MASRAAPVRRVGRERHSTNTTAADLDADFLPWWEADFRARNHRDPSPNSLRAAIQALRSFDAWLEKFDRLWDPDGVPFRNPAAALEAPVIRPRGRARLASLGRGREVARAPDEERARGHPCVPPPDDRPAARRGAHAHERRHRPHGRADRRARSRRATRATARYRSRPSCVRTSTRGSTSSGARAGTSRGGPSSSRATAPR